MTLRSIVIAALLFNACAMPQVRTSISLQPHFKEGFVLPLTLRATSTWGNDEGSHRQSISFSMRLKITERDGGLPSRVEFADVNGPQIVSQVTDTGEKELERMENYDGAIVGQVDAYFLLHDAKDIGHLSNDVLISFPPGPIIGFVPPKRNMLVGESWSSRDIVPVGPRTFKKRQFTFVEIKGAFKLESVSDDIAVISWTGDASVFYQRQVKTISGTAEWQRKTLFDVRNRMFKESSGILRIRLSDGTLITHEVVMRAEG